MTLEKEIYFYFYTAKMRSDLPGYDRWISKYGTTVWSERRSIIDAKRQPWGMAAIEAGFCPNE
ncbi:hypothetical protein, partial [Novosphingobium sp. MBES04]|uniref:hypothetical protein n=1 Tax=Novosphingobium sp. MBES04 TaxID=1206458 RepID=UPI00131F423C